MTASKYCGCRHLQNMLRIIPMLLRFAMHWDPMFWSLPYSIATLTGYVRGISVSDWCWFSNFVLTDFCVLWVACAISYWDHAMAIVRHFSSDIIQLRYGDMHAYTWPQGLGYIIIPLFVISLLFQALDAWVSNTRLQMGFLWIIGSWEIWMKFYIFFRWMSLDFIANDRPHGFRQLPVGNEPLLYANI